MRSHSASYPSPLAHQIEGRPCFSQTASSQTLRGDRAFLRRPQRHYKRKMRSHSASYPSPLAHQIERRPCLSQTSAAAL
ncbi:hypothetical protein RRG08_021976 [Elysia crispata]|uniref:Uncharacterized protein n=1 Tax=Elysia crispata TaxID=231223 RepID=A0AAE1B2H7_9GAST|nr:hypothetical protein RRG08_021976 [Elysia crispata]